jgi:hypothetical protein
MGMVRILKIVILIVVAFALAACAPTTRGLPGATSNSTPKGGSSASHDSVVTGFADSCSGLMEHVDVKVRLYSGQRLMATETVRSGARFRFSVHPGSYRVMADHRFDDVTVTAGHSVNASLLMVCL